MKLSEYILKTIIVLAVMIVMSTLAGCGGGTEDEVRGPGNPCVPAEVCK